MVTVILRLHTKQAARYLHALLNPDALPPGALAPTWRLPTPVSPAPWTLSQGLWRHHQGPLGLWLLSRLNPFACSTSLNVTLSLPL